MRRTGEALLDAADHAAEPRRRARGYAAEVGRAECVVDGKVREEDLVRSLVGEADASSVLVGVETIVHDEVFAK